MLYTVGEMIVTILPSAGNSSKFTVVANKGEFTIALSHTLRTEIWHLKDADAELAAAKELAEAIVSRHDPKLPFKPLYIFAEHTVGVSLEHTIQKIRKYGVEK